MYVPLWMMAALGWKSWWRYFKTEASCMAIGRAVCQRKLKVSGMRLPFCRLFSCIVISSRSLSRVPPPKYSNMINFRGFSPAPLIRIMLSWSTLARICISRLSSSTATLLFFIFDFNIFTTTHSCFHIPVYTTTLLPELRYFTSVNPLSSIPNVKSAVLGMVWIEKSKSLEEVCSNLPVVKSFVIIYWLETTAVDSPSTGTEYLSRVLYNVKKGTFK